ncbi:MAG: ATP-dependent zinc metalloprotease FtsH [Bacteroidia bacterium]
MSTENKVPKPKSSKDPGGGNKKPKFSFYWIYLVIAVVFLAINFFPTNFAKDINWVEVKKMLADGDIKQFKVVNNELVEVFLTERALAEEKYKDVKEAPILGGKEGPQFQFYIGDKENFQEQVSEARDEYNIADEIPIIYEPRQEWGREIFSWLIPIGIMVLIWIFIMRRLSGGGAGGQLFNIGKSKATLFDKDTKVSVTFKDVAGLEEAKLEVMEVVDFLKNPTKYTKLGGKIPKGVLLVGPPGTGKTLLAKAVAGEASVPFFSLSGSDFVEMFVGVGASRVRDLFKQAKEKAPCIIFIDEIDAIGRARGRNLVQGSNDERENTLNQLLTEMDGFSTNSGVILMAATNRPDVLDTALLRPGRFDRQISIDKPDIVGREQIFKVHLLPLKLAKDVEPKKLAAQTPGFAGAEIANVCNEAALIAARKGNTEVHMQDFHDAIDRVIGGLEKKNKIISPEEKGIVAYHEAGHAVVGWFLEHASPLLKVSIVPRGVAALGYAQYLPKEQYLYTKEQLLDTICMTLGGRVAEDIIFESISTGAQNDLERITKLSYNMITVFGMNAKIGNVSYNDPQGEYGMVKPFSEKTAEMIDEEMRLFIEAAYIRTKELLLSKKSELEKVAKALLEKEIIFQNDLEALLGPRPYENKNNIYHDFFNLKEENSESNGTETADDGKNPEIEKEEEVKSTSVNGHGNPAANLEPETKPSGTGHPTQKS